MKQHKISIITPSHRFHPYFEELYDSILSQTYKNWEWILYLNNNFQKSSLSARIILDPRVKIFIDKNNNNNIGYVKSMAFNSGNGDILLEMDHDDLLIDRCLEEINNAFQDETVNFVYSDNAVLHMKEQFVPFPESMGWSHQTIQFKEKQLFSMKSFPATSHSVSYIWYAPDHVRCWRTDFYKKIGGHNPELSVCDDHELMIRTYLAGKMYHIPKVLYIYRITGDNSWLERNELIQTTTKQLFNQYAQQLAEKDADTRGLLKLDLGSGVEKRSGYVSIDLEYGDVEWDLNDGIPFPDNSVGVINASHIIEHLKDPLKTMKEIHRVLAHGGWAFIEVPSTDGRGAFQDPTHVSYWNENSFWYYTRADKAHFIKNKTIRFQPYRLETNWWPDNIAVVNAALVAIKDDKPRYPGLLQI